MVSNKNNLDFCKKSVDKSRYACYYVLAVGGTHQITYARVVELVDSLDSGSSVHCGRAGSSPASRTRKDLVERQGLFFAPVLSVQ